MFTAEDPEGANFLEFLQHVRAVARSLIRHASGCESLGINRDDARWRPENMKFVCVDLDTEEFSVLAGQTPQAQEILFARENGNHFIPLRPSEALLQDLLPPGLFLPRDYQ